MPAWGVAEGADAAVAVAEGVGVPGARAALVRSRRPEHARLLRPPRRARGSAGAAGVCCVDRFLEGAVEIDVDALCDGT